MKICVVNASNPQTIQFESDSYVDYRDGRLNCFSGGTNVKQCTSWHSWAYSLETEFFVYGKPGWEGCFKYDGVILLTNRDPHLLIPLIKKLKLTKKKVAISFHEGVQDLITGSGMQGENLMNRWHQLFSVVNECDFYINLFGQMSPMFEGWFGKGKVKYCSHAAPLDWANAPKRPLTERTFDVLIGTRTLQQRLSRNTFVSIATLNGYAKESGRSVHYLSEDGNVGDYFKQLGINNINFHQGPFKWPEWLKFLSQFKAVCHFDHSLNLGQIAYDCALLDVIPVGSTTWNNMLIGNSDNADLRKTLYLLDDALTNGDKWLGSLSDFKKSIHPDKVREDLMRVFE